MKKRLGLVWLAVVVGAFSPVVASAQQALVVVHEGKPRIVRKVKQATAFFEDKGKLVAAPRHARAALAAVPEYLPFFVSVRGLKAGTSYVNLTIDGGGSGDVNNQFEFSARLESPYRLEDVFLVLELELEAGKYLFYHEVGELLPRRPRPINLQVPVSHMLGAGRFKLHLFSGGRELLHSEQPPLYRDQAVDKMVRRLREGVADAGVEPLVGPAPEYPTAFEKRKLKGEAVVGFTVTRTGATLDPKVVSASAPEFGDSALAAVRLWRFLPRMKNGQAVETRVELPFDFSPPDEN